MTTNRLSDFFSVVWCQVAAVLAILLDKKTEGSLAHRLQPGHRFFDADLQTKWNATLEDGGLTKKQKVHDGSRGGALQW